MPILSRRLRQGPFLQPPQLKKKKIVQTMVGPFKDRLMLQSSGMKEPWSKSELLASIGSGHTKEILPDTSVQQATNAHLVDHHC